MKMREYFSQHWHQQCGCHVNGVTILGPCLSSPASSTLALTLPTSLSFSLHDGRYLIHTAVNLAVAITAVEDSWNSIRSPANCLSGRYAYG